MNAIPSLSAACANSCILPPIRIVNNQLERCEEEGRWQQKTPTVEIVDVAGQLKTVKDTQRWGLVSQRTFAVAGNKRNESAPIMK